METALLALGSLAGAASAALALGGTPHGARRFEDAGTSALGELARAACRLGSRLPADAFLAQKSVRAVADALCQRSAASGAPLDRGGALVAIACGIICAAVLAGALSGSVAGMAAGAAAAALSIPLRASAIEREREKRLCQEMPAVFRTLAMALGSGKTLHQAIDYVGAQERGIIGDEFARASLSMRCGATPADALAELERRLDAPGMRLMTAALIIAQRTGSPLRDLFMRSARLVERQGEFAQMLDVKTAQVRLSVRVVSVLPAALVGILSIISRDFQQGLMSPIGAGCVLVAAALDGIAIMVIRHLMRGVA